MKNQNDLIVAGAIVLVCIGVSLVFMLEQRTPMRPAAPPEVVTTEAIPQGASVVYGNSLPGAPASSGGSGAQTTVGGGIRRGGPTLSGAGGG